MSKTESLRCDLEKAIENFDIQFLADKSLPDTEIVTAMAEYKGLYINYLLVLAKENSAPIYSLDRKSKIGNLEQVVQNFADVYFREEQLLEVKIVSEQLLITDGMETKIVSFSVSFDKKKQTFSAAVQQFGEFYFVVSAMPTLVEDKTEILSSSASEKLISEFNTSCDITIT